MNQRTKPGTASATTTARRPLLTLGTASAIYFGLAALYFLRAFLPGEHIYGTDYLVGGYFFHEFISSRFAEGVLPKWVPYVYGGLPLFANPGSTYYPFRFVADFIFPVSKIWPTLFVIQFTAAGIGMHLLARELGVRVWVAVVGALAFEFTGLTMSWVLAGHEGRIIVATFTPLVFFFFLRGIRTGRLAPFAGAAAAIGFCLLSFQIQVSYYLLLGALIWSVFLIVHLGSYREGGRLARVLAYGVAAVGFGFALASVNFLPFMDYVEQSPRGGPGRGFDYAISYSMPTAEISALAVPEAAGFLDTYRGTNPMKLHTEYVGAVVLVLALLGLYYARKNRYFWFFAGLALFALSISLGGNTPLYRLYYEILPATKRFRAPSISFFLVSFGLATMATLTLEILAARLDQARESRRIVRSGTKTEDGESVATWMLGGFVVLAFLVCAAAGSYRFLLFAIGTALVLWMWLNSRLDHRVAGLLLATLTVVDLWIVDRNFFATVPGPDEMFAADDVAQFLNTQPGRDRVWVLPFPPEAVYRGQAGNYLMRFGIDQAGGEHGNQLQRWNDYVGTNAETYVDWHNLLGSPVFLNAANIRYIVTGAPLDAPGLREVFRGSGVVYENPQALPRAYLVPRVLNAGESSDGVAIMSRPEFDPRREAVVHSASPVTLPPDPLTGTAQLAAYEPDRVSVRYRASREALLVLADNYYPGWTASIDGRTAPILRANHTMRAVVVPAGEHTVTFIYSPSDLYTGFTIYLVGMGLLVLYAIFLLVQRWRGRTSEPVAA
jgi:hypothetical protein